MTQKMSALVCMLLSGICVADSWTVDDDGKADFNSIQEAINAASDGDFISVQEGTYYESINFLGKAIRVEGINMETTIINGSSQLGAVVTFDTGETNLSVLSKFTIVEGTGNFWLDPIFGQQRCGGGIYCELSSPFIQWCTISNNSAWGGAGIFATEGSPSIFFSEISHNEADGHGGGLYLIEQVNSNIDSCDIRNNSASWGGGMTCTNSSDPLILNCSFNENLTYNVGGGMFIRSSSSPIVLSCEFNNNDQISNPLGSGGGVCIYGSGTGGGPCFPTFTFCTFIGNVVLGDGGGMSAAYDSHPKITTCDFRENQAGRSGGGLACVADADHLYPSNADVLDVTFESNHAYEEGGGIHVRWSDPIFEAVEVHDNEANNTGGGINFFDSPFAQLLGSQICGNSNVQVVGLYSDGGGNTIDESCGSCEGDVNGDGLVDVTDLLTVVGTWGVCSGNCPADIDGSGVIDVTDLLIIVGNWGDCP